MANEDKPPVLVVNVGPIPLGAIGPDMDTLYLNKALCQAIYIDVMRRPTKVIDNSAEAFAVLCYLATTSVTDIG